MKNKTLAIAIPTFNRAEIVYDCLSLLITEVVEYSIPIFISDNSSNSDTKAVFDAMKGRYKYLFYYKNTTDLGHDKNSFYVAKLPKTDYVWLLGDSFSLKKGAIKNVLHIIENNKPDIMSVNAANRDLDKKSGLYTDCNDILNDLAWHITLTGATIYSRKALSTIDQVEVQNFKNFPQIALIFNFLSENCSYYWDNNKWLIASPKKRGYWVSTMFSIFIDDWSNAIRNLPGCYEKNIKEHVIIDHSLRSNIFSFKSLLKARCLGFYDLKLFLKYNGALLNHSRLNVVTLMMISLFPRIFLRTFLLIKATK